MPEFFARKLLTKNKFIFMRCNFTFPRVNMTYDWVFRSKTIEKEQIQFLWSVILHFPRENMTYDWVFSRKLKEKEQIEKRVPLKWYGHEPGRRITCRVVIRTWEWLKRMLYAFRPLKILNFGSYQWHRYFLFENLVEKYKIDFAPQNRTF